MPKYSVQFQISAGYEGTYLDIEADSPEQAYQEAMRRWDEGIEPDQEDGNECEIMGYTVSDESGVLIDDQEV